MTTARMKTFIKILFIIAASYFEIPSPIPQRQQCTEWAKWCDFDPKIVITP